MSFQVINIENLIENIKEDLAETFLEILLSTPFVEVMKIGKVWGGSIDTVGRSSIAFSSQNHLLNMC